MAVMGAAAGGYLALRTGYRVMPPPQTLVSFWGYGDLAGPWSSKQKFPPTLLIHGTKDIDVPYEPSESIAAELVRHGVESELMSPHAQTSVGVQTASCTSLRAGA